MFGSKKEEVKEAPVATEIISIQRNLNVEKHLRELRKEKEDMANQIKDLYEKIEGKTVLISTYEKDISDHKKDIERISIKEHLVSKQITELEHESSLFNKGTHIEQLDEQSLQGLDLRKLLKYVKEFPETEKVLKNEIASLRLENQELKKAKASVPIKEEVLEQPPQEEVPEKSKPQEKKRPGFFKSLMGAEKKQTEKIEIVNDLNDIAKNLQESQEKPEVKSQVSKKKQKVTKKAPKKLSKKLLNKKIVKKVSVKKKTGGKKTKK